MITTKKSYDEIKIVDILAMGLDLIVEYKLDNDDNLRIIPVLIRHLSRFLENNLGEYLIDLLKYYLSTKKTIKILKIMKYKHIIFKPEDFVIKLITRRIYGNTELIYAKIYNRKTGVILEDWVRPNQIKSIGILNQLICWESEGDKIDFF